MQQALLSGNQSSNKGDTQGLSTTAVQQIEELTLVTSLTTSITWLQQHT